MANAKPFEDALHTSWLGSPTPALSSNFGSLAGSPDLERMGTRTGSTADEKLDAILSKFAHFEAQLAQIPALSNWMSRMESHVINTIFAKIITDFTWCSFIVFELM